MTSQRQRESAAAIRTDQAFWRALVAEVGRDRMHEPGPMGEWTFRDLAAHLAAWRNLRIPQFEALASGAPQPQVPFPAGLDDDDAINDWFHDRDQGRSLEDILADYDASFERLAKVIESMPEEVAEDPQAIPWLPGTAVVDLDFGDHLHAEHMPSVRTWLDSRR